MTQTRNDVIAWGSSQSWWILAGTVGASALAMLDATAVNVALPSIGAELDARVAGLQWTVNAYTLSLASLILLAGALADRYGRRRMLQAGIAIFALASLACSMASTLELLIAARALQGIGGALLTPGSLAIIQVSYAEKDRGRAIGAWSGLSGIAAAIGPLAGGWLVEWSSWRTVFWINLPLAAVVLWIAGRHIPESRAPWMKGVHFDVLGAILGAFGLGALTWALIASGNEGASAAVLVSFASGVGALAAFLLVERRASLPLVPLGLFSSRQFSAVNAVTFIVYGAMSVLFFLLVVYLQGAAGYPPLLAGMALVPVTALMLGLSSRAGQVAERIGPRRPMTIGPLMMAAGMTLLSRIGIEVSYLTDVLPGVIIFGLGLSATVAPLTATALAAADPKNAGVASGVNNAVARTASLLAVAVLPVVSGLTGDALRDASRFNGGFRIAMIISAALMVAGAMLAWITIRDSRAPGCAGPTSPRSFCAVDGPPLAPGDAPESSRGN
ncbi:MAG TPA: MFS transporter [Terriglobia bacterium]|nr:MFS transporter [Terriglobia bacterium]